VSEINWSMLPGETSSLSGVDLDKDTVIINKIIRNAMKDDSEAIVSAGGVGYPYHTDINSITL